MTSTEDPIVSKNYCSKIIAFVYTFFAKHGDAQIKHFTGRVMALLSGRALVFSELDCKQALFPNINNFLFKKVFCQCSLGAFSFINSEFTL